MGQRLLLLFLLGCALHGASAAPQDALLASAVAQVGQTLSYDPAYTKLSYPGGDVPLASGVCTDVVVRAFRGAGVDLQKAVHEDMQRAFSAYPQLWKLRAPDPNIDHRRVPNLMTYFHRQGKSLAASRNAGDYLPGDIVAWRLPDGRPHIGLVTKESSAEPPRLKIIHNIGSGARIEDRLFDFEIIGHYRYF